MSIVDEVKFEKQITLKEPKEKKSRKVSRRFVRLSMRFIQLILFLVTVCILLYGASRALLYTASYIKGIDFNSWQELIDDYQSCQ